MDSDTSCSSTSSIFQFESNEEETLESNSQIDDDDDEDNFQIRLDFKTALNNVRKIVKLFKASLVKNSILQKYVKMEYKKELQLILDSRTRWNSIEPMLERFLKLKDCIIKALFLNSLRNRQT